MQEVTTFKCILCDEHKLLDDIEYIKYDLESTHENLLKNAFAVCVKCAKLEEKDDT